jgi:NAD-dependent DNA ligase
MKILIPEGCPSCNALLERVNDQLFCPNNIDCPAQNTKKVQNFCSTLKIKGFGEATVDKLGITSIAQLWDLSEQDVESCGFSKLMATKLVAAISDRISQGITLPELLSACSIPLVGSAVSKKLEGYTVESFF